MLQKQNICFVFLLILIIGSCCDEIQRKTYSEFLNNISGKKFEVDSVSECNFLNVTDYYRNFNITFIQKDSSDINYYYLLFFTSSGFPAFPEKGYFKIKKIDDFNLTEISCKRSDNVDCSIYELNLNQPIEKIVLILEDIADCEPENVKFLSKNKRQGTYTFYCRKR
jgi:hypothetical protein